MTYADWMAQEALTRRWTDGSGKGCYSYDGERLPEVTSAIKAVIERCAQEAETWFVPAMAGGQSLTGMSFAKELAGRIRALATTPTETSGTAGERHG